jgi:hypothetical protein
MVDEAKEVSFISAANVSLTHSNSTWQLQPFFLGVAPTGEI